MDKIRIYHAYNGFLYAPLLLAAKSGFLPGNAELVFSNGDEAALEGLIESETKPNEVSFAICDPFSVDLNRALAHTRDEICVVGSLINKLPIWLFDDEPDLLPVAKEEMIKSYAGQISDLVTYKEGTTGFLIGKRVYGHLNLRPNNLHQADFGNEFNLRTSAQCAVLTSDVLKIVQGGLDQKKVLFNYASNAPRELTPYLFTGVLTLRSNVDRELWMVLAVLGALKNSIRKISENSISNRDIESISDIFEDSKNGQPLLSLGIPNRSDREKLVKEALQYVAKILRLYDDFPKPLERKEWIEGWNNARAEWNRHYPERKMPTVEQKDEPIPSLLIHSTWKKQIYNYFSSWEAHGGQSNPPKQLSKKLMEPRQKVIAACSSLITFISALVFINYISSFTSSVEAFAIYAITEIGLVYSFFQLRKEIFSLKKDIGVSLTFWIGILAIFIAIVTGKVST